MLHGIADFKPIVQLGQADLGDLIHCLYMVHIDSISFLNLPKLRRPSGQSLAEFSRPQTEKSILMYFFAGSAGEKIPLSPQVCGRCAAVRAGGCHSQN